MEQVDMNTNRYVGIGRQFPFRMEWFRPYKFKSCYLYMEKTKWIKLNKNGYVRDSNDSLLDNAPGVYAYRLIHNKKNFT